MSGVTWPGQEVTPPPSAPAPAPVSSMPAPVFSVPTDPLDEQLKQLQIKKAQQDTGDVQATVAGDTSKVGDAYLSTLPPNVANQVKALAEGRMAFPAGFALKSPYWQGMLTMVSQYDPQFDAVNYNARAKTRSAFTSGPESKQINALNTAIGHMGQLWNEIGGTFSGPVTPFNAAGNYLSKKFSGSSGVTNYESTAGNLAAELTRVWRGTGGNESDIQRYLDNLSADKSDEQKRGAIQNIVGLLQSKLEALGTQYAQGMGTTEQAFQELNKPSYATINDIKAGKNTVNAPGTPDTGAPPDSNTPGGNPPNGTPPNGGGTPQDVAGAAAQANGVTFGQQDTGAFDRNAYLQKTYGVSQDQEAALVGDWNAVSGNKNLTVEQGRQIYQSVGLPPPDDATLQRQVMNARKGASFQGIDTTAAEKAYTDQLDAAIKARGDNPESFGETAGTNLAQGITLNGLDELAGVGGAVRALAHGDNPVAGYQAERDIQRREQDRSEAAHPVAAPVFNVAGGLLTAPIAFGDANTVADAVKAGAALGGVAGFNSGRGAADSLTQGAIGAGLGAGLTVAGDAVASGLAARAAGKAADVAPSAGGETMAAADRLNTQFGTNIKPTPADVSGPGIRNITGGAAKFPASAQPIIAGAKKVTAEAQKARDAIAATVGDAAATPDAAGETALNGALSYIKTSKTKVNALYTKARQLGGSTPVDLANARAALDQNIAELSQTPGGAPALDQLKALRAELDQPYPVDGVRNMRTVLRDRFMGDGLRSTDVERRVGQVVDAAQQDVVNSLEAAGKDDAAQAYAAAANAHAARVDVIDNILQPIIGKNGEKSAEQVFQALGNASKTKGAQLGRFIGALPNDDAATVRASLIGRLGQVPAGQQNAAGDVFSLPAFLTHWNQMSETAKGQLFGGETRSALNDLAKVAEGTKEAQKFANFSNTGGVIGIGTTLAQAGGALTSPIAVATSLLAQYGGGRLLASPRFARWLAKMPKDPAAAAAHVRSLAKIATADATIAPDILGLQQKLMEAFTPSRLAAQPSNGTSTTGSGTR